MKNKHKIVLGITGASGSIYAKVLLDKLINLNDQIEEVGIIMSENAKFVWRTELNNSEFEKVPFKFYNKDDFKAPFASGSANYNTMIICPCSMGTLGRIASGCSINLIERCADVHLKEGRPLIISPRESPFNLIHLTNMKLLSEAGAKIAPCIPAWYSGANTLEEMIDFMVVRLFDSLNLDLIDINRWQGSRK